MKLKSTLNLVGICLCIVPTLVGEIIFKDTFETSLVVGTEQDLNFELASGRQTEGSISSTYSVGAVNGASALLQVFDATSSEVLSLQTVFGGENGTGPSSAYAALTENFSEALSGQVYRIRCDGFFASEEGVAVDAWLSLFISGSAESVRPNAATTDAGVIVRPNGRATIWDDNKVAVNIVENGFTGIVANTPFSLSVYIDETGPEAVATVIVNEGTENETYIASHTFSFEEADTGSRYIGLRANHGLAGGTTVGAKLDYIIDNLLVERGVTVPEAPAKWAGFDLTDTGYADTGTYLGWVKPEGDYVYLVSLNKYVYLPATWAEDSGGTYAYIPRSNSGTGGELNWAGFPVLDLGYVDTGSFLGWVLPEQDYLYSVSLAKYIYLPEAWGEAPGGSWVYIPR